MKLTRQDKRSLYERRRKKKFDYLKNTGQLNNYYLQRDRKEVIKEKVVKKENIFIKLLNKIKKWLKLQ